MSDRRAGPKFDIDAKLPQGASENQVPEMLQALLADRFKLTLHRGAREQEVSALVVSKGGLKVKEAAPEADNPTLPAEDPNAPPPRTTVTGGVLTRAVRLPNADGRGYTTTISSSRMGTVRQTEGPDFSFRWEAPGTTFAGLADLLDGIGPIPDLMDMTGLKGRYRVVLEVSMKDAFAIARQREETGGPPSGDLGLNLDMQSALLRALNDGLQKLGLQLERRKGPVETLVIDHVERTPTGN
jgi:uncharacterized protein (TIGR03435 family)